MFPKKQENSLQVLRIAKANLRHNFFPLFLMAIVVMVLTPVLFGTTNLDTIASAVPLEMLVSMIGIVLLVPIFHPEQSPEIKDVTASKYVDCAYVYIIRAGYSILTIVLLVLLFSAYMLACGCEITPSLVFGTIADAMFLGALGLLTAAVTNNLPVSFMIPLLYYVLTLTMKSKLDVFNIFAMMSGDYTPNIVLFVAGVGMIVVAIAVKRLLIKYR